MTNPTFRLVKDERLMNLMISVNNSIEELISELLNIAPDSDLRVLNQAMDVVAKWKRTGALKVSPVE